jgi:tetratricopeptide (TPR) repeat protein
MVLLPAYAIVMAGSLKWQRPAWALAGAFTAGVLIFVAPVVIQNWRVSGMPMIQAYGGMNVYLGNRPSGDGGARARPGGEWDRLEGDASREGASRAEQDRYYLHRALDEISRQPGAYLRLLVAKLLRAFEDEEVRDTHGYYFFAEAAPLLRWLPTFGWIIALAAAGLLATRGERLSYVAAYLVAMLLTVVFLVIGTRYRMPIVPPVIVLAGGGIAALLERARTRQWKGAAIVTVVAIVAWAASEWRSDPASRNLSEEWSFTGLSLLQERRLDEAEGAYRHAIALDESSFAWDGLGLVLQRRELRSDARDAFVHALRINPDNAGAWLHLGLAYEFLRDPRAAIDAYQNALKITPMRTEAQEMLSGALSRYRVAR